MNLIVPGLILALLVYALTRGVDIYDAFVSGAAEALPLMAKVLPYMAAMLVAIGVLRASGALDAFTALISPVLTKLGMPPGLVPLFVLRPFSGSASVSLLKDVFTSSGPDSFDGLAGSLMLGSTETVFYTIALYFGSVGVKRTRGAIPAALISGAVGALAAVLAARLMLQ